MARSTASLRSSTIVTTSVAVVAVHCWHSPVSSAKPTRVGGMPSECFAHDAGFTEIGDRCWVARFELFDVNVGLVGGAAGLLVVDTHASEVEALRVVEQVRALGVGEVVAVVNTHQHFDHTF